MTSKRKILSDASALREATKRWGKSAAVKREKCWLHSPNKDGSRSCSGFGAAGHGKGCPGGRVVMIVGRVEGVGGIQFFMILGTGNTWAEAFDQAERNGR